MTKQTSHKFSPEVRERAVRMVFDHQTEYNSQWATILSLIRKVTFPYQSSSRRYLI
jgi:transposase